jgi:hypothetical protein
LAGSTLTDPGGDSTNIAANESWPSALLPQSSGMELEQGLSGDRISITFYIYEWDKWRKVNAVPINPSKPLSLKKAVRDYKRQGMFVYDMKMQITSVSSSFQIATVDGVNTLLLILKKIKEKMDPR